MTRTALPIGGSAESILLMVFAVATFEQTRMWHNEAE
jgi:hypothetical protein